MEAAGTPPTGQEPTKPATPAPAPEAGADLIEGLRAWLAQLDRTVAVRTWIAAIALVLALAAGGAGVYFGLSAKDESATKDDVRALRDQVETVKRETSQAAKESVASVTDRLDALESRVSTIASGQRTSDSELSVVQDDIDDLRSQLADLERSASANQSSNLGGGNP
ncbi:MAG TPA: hypothetical protein VK326_10470 [Solirubrobacterales bacterium]|nr:hypothetical protein [Solirubrobacterales bacterium]